MRNLIETTRVIFASLLMNTYSFCFQTYYLSSSPPLNPNHPTQLNYLMPSNAQSHKAKLYTVRTDYSRLMRQRRLFASPKRKVPKSDKVHPPYRDVDLQALPPWVSVGCKAGWMCRVKIRWWTDCVQLWQWYEHTTISTTVCIDRSRTSTPSLSTVYTSPYK